MKKNIILSITSVVLFFILAEFAIRLFNVKFELPKYMKFAEHFQVDPFLSEGKFLKDPYVFWKLSWPKLPPYRKKDDKIFRIICIGDSVTFGHPRELNKLEDTYPKVLERLLNTFIKTRKFEVINAGVPGYTSYQGLQYLRHYLLKYEADLIITQFGLNDRQQALYFEDKNQKVQSEWLIDLQNILSKSRFYQLLGRIVFYIENTIFSFNPKNYRNIGKIVRVSPEDYQKNLEEMIRLGKKNNFKVLFIPPVIFNTNAKNTKKEIIIIEEYIPAQPIMTLNTYRAFKKWNLKQKNSFLMYAI